MGDLFDWLSKFVRQEAEHRTRIRIKSDHGPEPMSKEISPAAEQHYVRLWLVEMFLRNNREWFTTRYPLTYSLVEMSYGGKTVEFANVSGKNKLDIKQTDLGKSLLYEYPMTPLLPFHGGTISLDCGLVSMTADNAVMKFAGVVSEFAGKFGGAQIATAADLASSIASSVQDLLGAGNAVSKLYYHSAFVGDGGSGAPLTSGYLFLSEEPDGTIDADQLWITDKGIRTGPDKTDLLEPQDYMLIRIECVPERDDYRSFTYVSDPFEQALDAKADGDDAKGQLLLRQAKRAVMKSADFTKLDAKRIGAALEQAYANDGWIATTEATAALETLGRGGSNRLEQAVGLVSLDDAKALPDSGD